MALSQKQTIAQKLANSALALVVTISLVNSLVNPSVVKAAESAINAPDTQTEKPVRVAKRSMVVVATSYSSEAAQTDATPCIPAMWKFNLCDYFERTGIEDTIAANFLPLGTEVRFPDLYGDKIFVVRDRMNSKYNGKSRIDFWKSTKASAIKFGAQRITMEVL